MRRLHGIALASLMALLLSSATATLTPTADAAPDAPVPPSTCPTGGTPVNYTFPPPTPPTDVYFQSDPRLGPQHLPNSGQVGPLLDQYQRFMAMGPKNLTDCYWVDSVSGWRYPPNDGFEPGARHLMTVAAGRKLQLFGNPRSGKFVAPAGTLYSQEAIPPGNLDTFDPTFPFNYHLYLVCKDFNSEEGRIAPWFQQPGGGIQDFTGNQPAPFNNVGNLQKPAGPDNKPYIFDITNSPTTTACPSLPPS